MQIDKREIKRLKKLARKIVPRVKRRRLKLVELEDLEHSLKKTIVNSFEERFNEIDKEIKKFEIEGKDLFLVRSKILLLPSKLKHLQVDFSKEEFYKLTKLLKSIRKEVRNARVA